MSWRFTPTAIPDVVVVEGTFVKDDRGFFQEVFKASEFHRVGIPTSFVQTSRSRSLGRGTLRGLHFQASPMAQGKLVRCAAGECFDVAVDLRKGSPTFGQHVAMTLRGDAPTTLWIPEGFAHGFLTLTDVCDMEYAFTGSEYSGPHARSLLWNDPALGIRWPERPAILSEKDANGIPLAKVEGM